MHGYVLTYRYQLYFKYEILTSKRMVSIQHYRFSLYSCDDNRENIT